MDNETLKDIIIDEVEYNKQETLQEEKGLIDVFEPASQSDNNPDVVLLSPEQLSGDEPLTDEKKKLAAALAAARELGIIEDESPQSAETLANTSDALIEQVRQDYQTGTGQLLPEEGNENSLDRKAARFSGNVSRVLDNLVDKVGIGTDTALRVWSQKAFDYIEEQWPSTSFLRPAAEKLVEVLDEKVIGIVVSGARKIAEKVKSAVESATEKVKVTVRKVSDFIKGLF